MSKSEYMENSLVAVSCDLFYSEFIGGLSESGQVVASTNQSVRCYEKPIQCGHCGLNKTAVVVMDMCLQTKELPYPQTGSKKMCVECMITQMCLEKNRLECEMRKANRLEREKE